MCFASGGRLHKVPKNGSPRRPPYRGCRRQPWRHPAKRGRQRQAKRRPQCHLPKVNHRLVPLASQGSRQCPNNLAYCQRQVNSRQPSNLLCQAPSNPVRHPNNPVFPQCLVNPNNRALPQRPVNQGNRLMLNNQAHPSHKANQRLPLNRQNQGCNSYWRRKRMWILRN